jgi:hypothetical protein
MSIYEKCEETIVFKPFNIFFCQLFMTTPRQLPLWSPWMLMHPWPLNVRVPSSLLRVAQVRPSTQVMEMGLMW